LGLREPAAAPIASTPATNADLLKINRNAGLHYFIENGHLIIDSLTGKSDKSRASERYFTSGVRKHADICGDLKKTFDKYGL
jgi:hypothetical protein